MASLLVLIRQSSDDTNDPSNQSVTGNEEERKMEAEEVRKWGRLGNLLQKQVKILRVEMAEADRSEAEKEEVKKAKDMIKEIAKEEEAAVKKGNNAGSAAGLADYQEQLMLLEMHNKARAQ